MIFNTRFTGYLFLTVLVALSHQLYEDEPSIIKESNKTWVVQFFSCPHCVPTVFTGVAKEVAEEGLISVGVVNCDDEDHLCGVYNVEYLPDIKFINRDKIIDYEGRREVDDIVREANMAHQEFTTIY